MKCRVPYSALIALVLSLGVSSNALAYEATSPVPTIRQYLKIPEKRDPYLVQAINSLPNYSYTQSGFATANSSHITKRTPVSTRIVTINAVNNSMTATVAEQKTQPIAVNQANQSVLIMEGEASYYSRAGCLGCSPNLTMANGQPLNDHALTMAIGADKKHLVGRQARITNLATGKSTVVTITDTGGFYQAKYGNRVADLTIASKQAIGMNGGVGQVRVEVF